MSESHAQNPLNIEVRTRIVHDYTVTLTPGFTWDAIDLLGTLADIKRGGVSLYGEGELGRVLVKLGVLTSYGGREHEARTGPKFEDFVAQLSDSVNAAAQKAGDTELAKA